MNFTKRPYNNLKDEIYSVERNDRTMKIFVLILLLAGALIFFLSHAYATTHYQEIVEQRAAYGN